MVVAMKQPRSTRPWWQSWWTIGAALVLLAPVGLVLLWLRHGTAIWAKVAITASIVAVLFALFVPTPLFRHSSDGPLQHSDQSN
jgi:membrane protein YdbS with pleckstrin-like domain